MSASFILRLQPKAAKILHKLQFQIHQQTQQQPQIHKFQNQFQELSQLIDYINQLITHNGQQIRKLNQLTMIFVSETNQLQETRRLLSLRNTICGLFVANCRFITGCKIVIEPSFQIQPQADQQNNLDSCLLTKNIFQWKFITEMLLEKALKKQEFKHIALHPFTYLKGLQLIKIQLNNKMLYYLSKARWPNLTKLNLKWGVQGYTADGIKYLQKHGFSKLDYVSFRADVGSELSRKMTKVRSLDSLQINECSYSIQLFVKQSLVKEMFVKQLVKSPLMNKYLDCSQLSEIKNRIRSEPYQITF